MNFETDMISIGHTGLGLSARMMNPFFTFNLASWNCILMWRKSMSSVKMA